MKKQYRIFTAMFLAIGQIKLFGLFPSFVIESKFDHAILLGVLWLCWNEILKEGDE